MKIFRHLRNAALVRWLIFLLLGLFVACPADNQTKYTELHGRIVITGLSQIDNTWIGIPVYTTIYPRYRSIWDSTRTDSTGTYFLNKGFPEVWENTTSCTSSPSYVMMGDFALLIAPENRDTSIILFSNDSSFADPDYLSVPPTQVFIGEHHFQGEPGEARVAPTITLEY